MKQMIFKTKEGEFDFTNKKVRLNGRVLDKYSLCAAMQRLDWSKFQYATLYTYDICTYAEIKEELHQYLIVWDEVETAKRKRDENYLNLWNEFVGDWHFTTLPHIGGFTLYRSHDTFYLATYKEDKRCYDNYRMVDLFHTDSYEEMREYLIANNPTPLKEGKIENFAEDWNEKFDDEIGEDIETPTTSSESENTINVCLDNGETTKAVKGFNFIVQYWNGGKWHNKAVFNGTIEGYESAKRLMQSFEYESQIVTFY